MQFSATSGHILGKILSPYKAYCLCILGLSDESKKKQQKINILKNNLNETKYEDH